MLVSLNTLFKELGFSKAYVKLQLAQGVTKTEFPKTYDSKNKNSILV